MKLRRFDSTNTVQARETKPCVTVSATGVWRANGALSDLETEHPSGRMLVGEEPLKADGLTLYPVLTSSLVYRKRKPRS